MVVILLSLWLITGCAQNSPVADVESTPVATATQVATLEATGQPLTIATDPLVPGPFGTELTLPAACAAGTFFKLQLNSTDQETKNLCPLKLSFQPLLSFNKRMAF